MKQSTVLRTASLLSILFGTFHLADDVVRGFEPGGPINLTGILLVVIWLYGVLVLADRRSGQIIMLLGSFLAAGVPAIHMRGAGVVGGRIANSNGKFFWVWTLLALGSTGAFSAVLAARALWSGFDSRTR